jgi:Transposase DDE domain/Domain of unknown function (DUF4372)
MKGGHPMKNNITIFKQILHCIPNKSIEQSKYIKHFTSENLLATLLYAQICGKDTLREIETDLKMHEKEFRSLGVSPVSRSNLSYALNNRDYKYFEDFFQYILGVCQSNCHSKKFKFKNQIADIDSSVIDLCLKIFPWAKYQTTKGALKLHATFDINKGLPTFVMVTEGKASDIKIAKDIDSNFSSDSILTFDRGYIDYKWYNKLTQKNITFVTRVRKKMVYEVLGQHSNPSISSILKDEEIEISSEYGKERYPGKLRIVTYHDKDKKRTTEYLTNNFEFAASTIVDIYKHRWDIESFFRWIKQNLKIKSFLGTSKNAVLLQVYAAMIYYLLLKYLAFLWKFDNKLTELSRRIQACLWKKDGIDILLSRKLKLPPKTGGYAVQLTLFESS